MQNQPCKFNWYSQTCSHLFILLIKSTGKLAPSFLKNNQGLIFSFKVRESSQRISQTVFSFRVTVANILQTHGNVHKPIHAKDHLWFCIEICPWGNLVLLNLNVFNLQGQATSCEPFLIGKTHHGTPWNSNKQAPWKMIVSWLNIYTINSCMWGQILCRNTVWSSPCLAIRKLMGVLVCEFLSGKAQWYLPKMNAYECEITPWFCAHRWQISTLSQCFRILYIYILMWDYSVGLMRARMRLLRGLNTSYTFTFLSLNWIRVCRFLSSKKKVEAFV